MSDLFSRHAEASDRFDAAWRQLEAQGKCDAIGGRAYERVRVEWITAGSPSPIEPFITARAQDIEINGDGNLTATAAPDFRSLLFSETSTRSPPPLSVEQILAAIEDERLRSPLSPGVFIDESAPIQRIVKGEDGSEKTVLLLCCGLPGDRLGDRHRYLVHPDRFALFKSTVERCGFKLEATGRPLPEAPWILVPAEPMTFLRDEVP